MNLIGRAVHVGHLNYNDHQQMLRLMDRHYENVCPVTFQSDLQEKLWVIQLFDSNTNELCGFSTLTLIDTAVNGRPIRALFSGDTIIDRSKWGDQALAYAWAEFALQLVDQSPDQELWWFLIAAGYKTYRFLPVFFNEFYPRFDRPTPPEVSTIIDALARYKYSDSYDSDAGVIRAGVHQYRLRDGIADITAERLRDPHIQFFADKNPGHIKGDELCCVARLSRDNFTRAAHRIYPIHKSACRVGRAVGE